jgi:hypothetical protein
MSVLNLCNASEWKLLKTKLDIRLCMEWNTPSVIGGSKIPLRVFLTHALPRQQEPCTLRAWIKQDQD